MTPDPVGRPDLSIVDALATVATDDELASRLRHPSAVALAKDPTELRAQIAQAIVNVELAVAAITSTHRRHGSIDLDVLRSLTDQTRTLLRLELLRRCGDE